MISVCMCISEHTVKTIVQGMRKNFTPTCKKRPLDLRTHSGSKKRPLDLRTQNGCGHHLNKFGLRWTKVYDHGMISATHIGINNSPA